MPLSLSHTLSCNSLVHFELPTTRTIASKEVSKAITKEMNKVQKGKNFTIEEDKQALVVKSGTPDLGFG
jgi:hypothetical protein